MFFLHCKLPPQASRCSLCTGAALLQGSHLLIEFENAIQTCVDMFPDRACGCFRVLAQERFHHRFVNPNAFRIPFHPLVHVLVQREGNSRDNCGFNLGILNQFVESLVSGAADDMQMKVEISLITLESVFRGPSVEPVAEFNQTALVFRRGALNKKPRRFAFQCPANGRVPPGFRPATRP